MNKFSEQIILQIKDGAISDLSDISEDKLYMLYTDPEINDASLGNLFAIPGDQVSALRHKFQLTDQKIGYLQRMFTKDESLDQREERSGRLLMSPEFISRLPYILTHFIFRNGPVEDMHSAGKLSDDDMKTLNRYMVNSIATLLHFWREEQWSELFTLLKYYMLYGQKWDSPEYRLKEICDILELEGFFGR